MKPYSKIPPNCKHDEVMADLKPFLVEQRVGIRKWPGGGEGNNHKVMNIYDTSSRKVRDILLAMPSFFEPIQNALPEDICFYRDTERRHANPGQRIDELL